MPQLLVINMTQANGKIVNSRYIIGTIYACDTTYNSYTRLETVCGNSHIATIGSIIIKNFTNNGLSMTR